MTASIQPESKAPSRRALLAGALGGLGALAASAIGRASPARAANGGPVILGQLNEATANTLITTTDTSALYGQSSAVGADAVFGYASAATGGSWGVRGTTESTQGSGVVGTAVSNSGATYGVQGQAYSPSGVGVYGINIAGGLALRAAGRAKFDTSGVATITAGHASKVITPGVNVTSSSFVLLTAKANIGSRALWFTTDAPGNKFTIHMSSSRSSGTNVAWLLLG
jgi:hypothetical protein